MRAYKRIHPVIFPLLFCLAVTVQPAAGSLPVKWRLELASPASGPALSAASDSVFSFDTGDVIGESSPAIGPDSTIYIGAYDGFLYAVRPNGTLRWKFATGGKITGSPAVTGSGEIIFGSTDSTVYAVGPDGSLKWKYTTGGPVFSQVALDLDGTVYVAPWDEYLYALNPDGTEKWKVSLSQGYAGYTVGAGPALGVLGTVYVGADKLYAVSPGGTVKWSFGAGGHRPVVPAAVDAAGTIYFQTLEAMFAVHPDGTQKFGFPSGGGWSPVSLDSDRNVYFGAGDGTFYSLDSTGALNWSYSIGAGVHSAPALDADSALYFGCEDSSLYALNLDGTLKWQYKTGGPVRSSPVIGEQGTVYLGSRDGFLYAFDTGATGGPLEQSDWPEFGRNARNCFRARGQASIGEVAYSFKTGGTVSSSPAVAEDGAIFFGSWDTWFYALDAEGLLQWKFKANGWIIASPAIGTDGTVYFGTKNGRAYALGQGGAEKWSLPIPGSILSQPALGPGGKVYFTANERLHAVNAQGRICWTHAPADNRHPPAISENGACFFISGDGLTLVAVNANGTYGWKHSFGKPCTGGVSIGPGTTVYAAPGDLVAVGPDGTQKWKFEAAYGAADAASRDNLFLYTPVVGPDSTVYVAGQDNKLHAINPWGTLKWRAGTGSGAVMPPVIAADGTIYVTCRTDSLYALDSGHQGAVKWITYLGRGLEHSYPGTAALGPDGYLYLGTQEDGLVALKTDSDSGLAAGAWPKAGANARNSNSLADTLTPPVRACDFSGDKQINIADVIYFLLLARDDPGNPRLDWNGDGAYVINDAIALMKDINSGNCPDSASALLAGAGRSPRSQGRAGMPLSEREIQYLEDIFKQLPLSAEELSTLRLTLYGEPALGPALPRAFSLYQNFPNPFNPATTIGFEVPADRLTRVSLKVYDLRGRLVRTLVQDEREPGAYSVFWDGTDSSGKEAPSGVYLYRLQAKNFSGTRKMVLLK
ncbi:MAG: PQQ-binding-like beta-propeller repeat protein [Gemmatimonadota bacterium]|nr:PQQ-binding-like beta-propeller repeat protein [Gemmatimonadota bacterium]